MSRKAPMNYDNPGGGEGTDSDSDDDEDEQQRVLRIEHQRLRPECYDNSLLKHPFWNILQEFEPRGRQLLWTKNDQLPAPLERTPFVFINERKQLNEFVNVLKGVREMAVWVKTSRQAFEENICLLGMANDKRDYLIDLLSFRVEELKVLQPFFADPEITKVFMKHERNRFYFLQQKLRLYCVNIFDVIPATKYVLGDLFREGGFYNRLRNDLGVPVVGEEQVMEMDFCRRPLTVTQIDYCRHSYHYLLYYYRMLKNAFIDGHMYEYRTFLQECNRNCMVYVNSPRGAAFEYLDFCLTKYHERQLFIARRLMEWRDGLARALNVNPNEILANSQVQYMALQRTPEDNIAALNCTQSKYVAQHIGEIAVIFVEATAKFGKYSMKLPRRFREADKFHKVNKAKPQVVLQRPSPQQSQWRGPIWNVPGTSESK